jgi:hypothetical protein
VCTKASPPLPPEPPRLAAPAAANALRLAWEAPCSCGAPVTGYTLDMARAAALAPLGPPTPPQARCLLLHALQHAL